MSRPASAATYSASVPRPPLLSLPPTHHPTTRFLFSFTRLHSTPLYTYTYSHILTNTIWCFSSQYFHRHPLFLTFVIPGAGLSNSLPTFFIFSLYRQLFSSFSLHLHTYISNTHSRTLFLFFLIFYLHLINSKHFLLLYFLINLNSQV